MAPLWGRCGWRALGSLIYATVGCVVALTSILLAFASFSYLQPQGPALETAGTFQTQQHGGSAWQWSAGMGELRRKAEARARAGDAKVIYVHPQKTGEVSICGLQGMSETTILAQHCSPLETPLYAP